jgi:hypothetical protein
MMITVNELRKGVHNAKSVPTGAWILLIPIMSLAVLTWCVTSGSGVLFQSIMTGVVVLVTLVFLLWMLGTVD